MKFKIMIDLVPLPDLCLVMASLQLCLLTLWSAGELVHTILHFSACHRFSSISANEQGEQKVAATVGCIWLLCRHHGEKICNFWE